jgi:Ca2+-binding RTX toxin-like protein
LAPLIDAGTALRFDGDDYITSDAAVPASGTWEAWVKKDDWSALNDDRLIGNGIGHPLSNSFYVSLHDEQGLHFRYGGFADAGNVASFSNLSSTTSLSGWHHLAATWQRSGSSVTLKTFIDGVQNSTSSSNINIDVGSTFFLGGDNLGNPGFSGDMDEVRIWDHARSETEIAATMNVTLIDPQLGLVAYYRLDDATGTKAADASTPAQDGSINGAGFVPSDAPIENRGIAFVGTDGDDLIRIWWEIDDHHQGEAGCAFETPGCRHLDFLNVTINGEVVEMEYTPNNNGETIFVFGGEGHDRIIMTPEAAQHWNAEFYGGDGDDTLIGAWHRFGNNRGGKDRLYGGPGDDTLQGGEGNDRLIGGPGSDLLVPFNGLDVTGTTTSLLVNVDESDRFGAGIIEWDFDGTREIDGLTYNVLRRETRGKTYFGDANLDGQFDTGDLVQVFKANEFEDDIDGNSTWAEGDFNADGDFDADDLILALQFGMYEGHQEVHLSVDHDHEDHAHPAARIGSSDLRAEDDDHNSVGEKDVTIDQEHDLPPAMRQVALNAVATDELFIQSNRFGSDNRHHNDDEQSVELLVSARAFLP